MSHDPLSVDSIRAAKQEQLNKKVQSQASNNVLRQQFAASQRAESGLGPTKGSKASGPDYMDAIPPSLRATPARSSKAAAASGGAKPSVQEVKDENAEILKLAQIVRGYFSNAKLAPMIADLAPPSKSASLEELKAIHALINQRLNQGISSTTVKRAWLYMLITVDPHLNKLPSNLAVPPGSSDYAAMRMEELSVEFEQIAVELLPYFNQGPWARLAMGTLKILGEYKMLAQQHQQAVAAQSSAPTEDNAATSYQSNLEAGRMEEEEQEEPDIKRESVYEDEFLLSEQAPPPVSSSTKGRSRKARA